MKYIIFTNDIRPIGGMQLYTAGKAMYLEKNGHDVQVFYAGAQGDCAIKYLNKFTKCGFPELYMPPTDIPQRRFKYIIENILKDINKNDRVCEQVYIESHNDITALWAEVIAEELGAKHICFNCNEQFRGNDKYYEDYIDFFKYKFYRKELLGLRPDTQQRLFLNYEEVPLCEDLLFDAAEPEPIQDVYHKKTEEIECQDYNIMYLGRADKGYVPAIIQGVAAFAKKHSDKRIQFVIVGNAMIRNELINKTCSEISNLSVLQMGDLVPIPRSIYSKIDVVIAGAVCAEISAYEGVPTIVADCDNYMANGVLGYTVFNSMYAEEKTGQTTYEQLLDDVLIEKQYKRHTFCFPKPESTDDIYESHFKFYELADNIKKYYPVMSNKSSKPYKYIRLCYLRIVCRYPQLVRRIRNCLKV